MIYKVTIERTLLVVADSDYDALLVGRQAEREDVGNADPESITAVEIKTRNDIPKEWIGSYPYSWYDSADEVLVEDYFPKEVL